MKQLVEMESCSTNTPPLARVSYVENVHEFLGGKIVFVESSTAGGITSLVYA